MINALSLENTYFFIHLDSKSDIQPFHEFNKFRKVIFIEDRIPVYWGELSVCRAI